MQPSSRYQAEVLRAETELLSSHDKHELIAGRLGISSDAMRSYCNYLVKRSILDRCPHVENGDGKTQKLPWSDWPGQPGQPPLGHPPFGDPPSGTPPSGTPPFGAPPFGDPPSGQPQPYPPRQQWHGGQDPGQYQVQPSGLTYGELPPQPAFTPQGHATWGQPQPYEPQVRQPPLEHPVSRRTPSGKRPRKGRRLRLVLWALIGIALAIILIFALTPGRSAKYSAHVISYTPINPADLAVAIKVTNTGSKAGTPTCTIDAQDPSYTYTGVDVVTLQNPVAPGASATFVDNLTIAKQGARYVTQVTASC